MTSVASYPYPKAMSTMYDINDFQLGLILKSTIPRLDVLHKVLDFIKTTKLDGKGFMGLNNKKLANLASYDPLTISQFQGLRVAQPQDIQLLLESRWKRPQSPEPTTTTLQETSYTEDTHDEDSIDPVSNPDAPSDVLIPLDPASPNMAPDTTPGLQLLDAVDTESVSTQSSTDAAQNDSNGSPLNRESSTHHMAPDERPLNLEPVVAAKASPIDPHSVPLPQPHDSELDLLNVEEDDIYDDETFSEEAIDSGLEADTNLSSDDDTSDDESQAWSLVGDEEIREAHVFAENEVEDLQAESSSLADATHETLTEHQLVTSEDPSIVEAPDVDASSAAQSPPVDESDPGIDQIISAGPDSTIPSEVSEPDGQHAKGIEVQDSHLRETGVSLPTLPLAENDESQQDLSPTMSNDQPSSINVSVPEISAHAPDATNSTSPAGDVETDQSYPADCGLDPPQTVRALEQPSTTPPEPVTPGFTEGDQEPTSEGTEDTQPPETVSTKAPSENVVNLPPEEQTSSKPVANEVPTINLEESHSEGIHTEQPISEEPSTSPFESAIPENAASIMDETLPACPSNLEETTAEVTPLSDPSSTQTPPEIVVNDLPEGQPDSMPVLNEHPAINLEETQSKSTHAEQLLPSLPNPVLPNPPEVHSESAPITDNSAAGVQSVAEELGPITFEDTASSAATQTISASNDDIPVVHVEYSPVGRISVELDISASASPSSSTRSVFTDSPFSNRFHSEFHLVAPVSPALCFDKCNLLLFREGVCEDYSTYLTSPSVDVTHLLPFSWYEESNLPADDSAKAANENEPRLVDHPLPNDDTEPDDPMSFLSLEDLFYDPFALDEASHQNGEPASSSSDNLIDLLDEAGPIEVPAEGTSMSDTILVPVESTLLDEDRAEGSGPAPPMRDSVPLPGASVMNEAQLTDGNQVEETSILSEETAQQAFNEVDPALRTASGMNEAQLTTVFDNNQEDASVLSNETVPQAPDDATSAIHDSDPVDLLPAALGMNEGQLTDDNQVEETLILSNDSVQPPNETDPDVPLPLADDLTGVDNNQETVQQASNESTSDESLSETEDRTPLHVVETSRFRGLPPINTDITSLSDDLSAYMSPEYCNTHNPILQVPYPTPFSSRPRLSPGSPRSPRTLYPMYESFTSERAIANYTKRLHEALERPAARSIAIQTDLERLDPQRRIHEENSTASNISPLSIFASPLRLIFGFERSTST